MRVSSIAKHHRAGSGSALSLAIGHELRTQRLARGLTQADLGDPLTRAYVSAVEHGHALPSIPALAMLTDRLGIALDDFFTGVNSRMTPRYNRRHGDTQDPPTRRRR